MRNEASEGWLPAVSRDGFHVEYRREGSKFAVKDKSGKITTVSSEAFFDDYAPQTESAGMSRLGRLVEGSTIKKRTTTWPDGTVQVDEDLTWDDEPEAKKESAALSRLGRLVEVADHWKYQDGRGVWKTGTKLPGMYQGQGSDQVWFFKNDDDGLTVPVSGSRLKSMTRLSEAEAYATITINGNKQFVKPFDDGIHLAFSRDGNKWGIPLHIAQLTQHPSGDYRSIEGIKAAGKALEKWLANPVVKDLGVFGA